MKYASKKTFLLRSMQVAITVCVRSVRFSYRICRLVHTYLILMPNSKCNRATRLDLLDLLDPRAVSIC